MRLSIISILILFTIGPLAAHAHGMTPTELHARAAAFVAISSTVKCQAVRMNARGRKLESEMKKWMREGDMEVRKVASQYASIELVLMKNLGKKHCKSVLDRYPDYMEIKPAP